MRTPVTPQHFFGYALLAALLGLSACGGDNSKVGNDPVVEPVASFQVHKYFENRHRGGVSFTLQGTFTDGASGVVTQQRQDHRHFPGVSFAGPWQGYSDVILQSAEVVRYVDGQPSSVPEIYNAYYSTAGDWLGSQADGQTDYELSGPFRIAPMSAQIGDSGSGPVSKLLAADGTMRQRTMYWEMKRTVAGDPIYCETFNETRANGNPQSQTWCYGMTEDGTPTPLTTYTYDSGGFVGSMSAINLSYPLAGASPAPSTERKQSYRVRKYFENILNDGASYTLIGTFTSGSGQVTQQRHEQIRFPIGPFGDWLGKANVLRQRTRVDRYVNGQPGESDTYNVYYDATKAHVGSQTDGSFDYRLADSFSTRPLSAQIGDTGSGPDTITFNGRGERIGQRTVTKWEMTRNAAGEPTYCETIEDVDTAQPRTWEYKWCYGMKQDGTPTNYLAFTFNSGGGSVGSIVATDFQSPLRPEPPPPPPACRVNCGGPDDNSGF